MATQPGFDWGTSFHGWNRASFASDVTNPVLHITVYVKKDEAHYSWNIMPTHTCDRIAIVMWYDPSSATHRVQYTAARQI